MPVSWPLLHCAAPFLYLFLGFGDGIQRTFFVLEAVYLRSLSGDFAGAVFTMSRGGALDALQPSKVS